MVDVRDLFGGAFSDAVRARSSLLVVKEASAIGTG